MAPVFLSPDLLPSNLSSNLSLSLTLLPEWIYTPLHLGITLWFDIWSRLPMTSRALPLSRSLTGCSIYCCWDRIRKSWLLYPINMRKNLEGFRAYILCYVIFEGYVITDSQFFPPETTSRFCFRGHTRDACYAWDLDIRLWARVLLPG
jgi:hypothetical protein